MCKHRKIPELKSGKKSNEFKFRVKTLASRVNNKKKRRRMRYARNKNWRKLN